MATWTIKVRADFDAAHKLRGYKGKCGKLHGHRWVVEFVAEVEALDNGMALDFSAVKGLVEPLDHQNLNELPRFRQMNPTAENIALGLYLQLGEMILKSGRQGRVVSVEVWESTNCSARFEAP